MKQRDRNDARAMALRVAEWFTSDDAKKSVEDGRPCAGDGRGSSRRDAKLTPRSCTSHLPCSAVLLTFRPA